MFTGLVEHLGAVVEARDVAFGRILVIDSGRWAHAPSPGESIAVNGCCLTVTAGDGDHDRDHDGDHDRDHDRDGVASGHLRFDVIRQTLDATTLGDLAAGDAVNLEHAVTAETLLGGHIVQGHIDGVAVVSRVQRDESEWRVAIEPPPDLMDVIVEKGSVAVDGVSLTVAALERAAFEVALIPTTLEMTTLGRAEAGTRVNIETDYVAKTVVHWLRRQHVSTAHGTG